MTVERAGGDAVHRIARESRDCIDESEPGRELRPAPHARTKTLTLRRRCRGEETPVVMVRYASRTNRPAIDARCDDPDIEHAIEARVTRVERASVDIGLGCESGNYRRGHRIKLSPGFEPVRPYPDAELRA